ncbi:peptidoglycan DD-metalloendopeptidase family protein [Streptomyces asiaticus]
MGHSDYDNGDPLFGAMPSAYGTTPAAYVEPAHQAAYDTGGYDSAMTWATPSHAVMSSSAVGVGLADANGHGNTTPWADSTNQWHNESYSTTCVDGYESRTQMWSTGADADRSIPSASHDSPGSPAWPGDDAPGQEAHSLAPEPRDEPTALLIPPLEDSEGTTQANSEDEQIPPPVPRRADARNGRASARRSALLTVAVPSVAVMAMTGAAAVSVSVDDQDEKATQAAPDATPAIDPSAANSKVDAQLAGLTTDADNFADRASRTQERIDLKQRQQQEQRRKAAEAAHRKAEAARKEALRPKFALPVTQRGVGELFGAAGSMWSSRHTGLDFPVPMNTPVMAVTDGTVEAKWNPFYGNMVVATAPDGTETWYCHLASAKVRAGQVKAGDVIAYAGSSGNSSGPHLHLEVHPGGGDAIDPLAWLRAHGLDPT